ncbi:site-2 protease family protein [Prochlorococcus marinus]|uniref:Zinc metalloprotease n=2 Tax=Prochlorococcus marinus TaxID=1219 RepID=A0A318R6C9_PROMR|nr:site-2 protease family protein [Prochlorococcus marinus]MBW3041564.1 multidrug transporter [Prochlorococcus marinus str. XMU1408]PYE03268.1 multidrug transporter [Prochlorococcus marinus XMU1408]
MKIRGIPLRIHPSWFFVFLYFTLSARDQFETLLDGQASNWNGWLIGAFTSLLLFLSVLLHELAHSFVAIGEGLKVREITLFFLGGMANLEKECTTSKGSLKIAISGPIVSLLLAFSMILLSNTLFESSLIISNLFKQVGSLNLLIGLFNLLPIIPLDGGVILKSLIWHFTGSKKAGIKVAIASARFISILSIFIGFLILLRGNLYISFCFLIIGLFIFSSSKSQSQLIKIQNILSMFKVGQVCSRSYRVLEDDLPIKVLSKYNSLNKGGFSEEWFLLCRDGRWVGYVTEKILKNISIQNWDKKFLYDFSLPIDDLPSVGEKESLYKAIIKIENTKDARLLVLSVAGLPLGTLDRVDIGKAVLKKIGLNLPDQLIKVARKENIYPLGLNLSSIAKTMESSYVEEDQK